MIKEPQIGEIWQGNDNECLYYIVGVDKFSVFSVTGHNNFYAILNINKYDFVMRRHYIGMSKVDVGDLFKIKE